MALKGLKVTRELLQKVSKSAPVFRVRKRIVTTLGRDGTRLLHPPLQFKNLFII